MKLILTRHRQDATGTYGVLMAPAVGVWATVEAPWVPSGEAGYDWGKKGKSCLPDGEYVLTWAESPKYGDRWHIRDSTDDTCGVTLKEVEGCSRSHTMIHPANWAKQLKGCIALGLAYAPASNPSALPMVTSSRKAVNALQGALQTNRQHTLIIETHFGEPWE